MNFLRRLTLPPRLAKEARLLFWPWCAIVAVVSVPLWILVSISYFIATRPSPTPRELLFAARLPRRLTVPELWGEPRIFIDGSGFAHVGGAGLLLGCVLLVALSFGAEFQSRTLPMLLSQPSTRLRLWGEKMIVLAGLLLLAAAVLVVGLSHNFSRGIEIAWLGTYTLLPLVCSTGYWTLFARSTLGGMAFSLGALAAVMMTVTFAVGKIWEGQPFMVEGLTPLVMSVVGLAYAALFLWLSWWKFSRLELNAPDGGESGLGVSSTKALPIVALLRCGPGSPFANLARKELRLLLPLPGLAVLFALFWLALAWLVTEVPSQRDGAEILLQVGTVLYMALTFTLAGCLPLCEERSLGLHPTNLTLPVTVSSQWRIKLLVALAVGLAAGVALPLLLADLTAPVIASPLGGLLSSWQNISLGLALVGLLTLLGFWSATLVGRVTHAILVSALTFGGLAAALWVGIRAGGGKAATGFMAVNMNVTCESYFNLDWVMINRQPPPGWFMDLTAWTAAHWQLTAEGFGKIMRAYRSSEFPLWPVVFVIVLALAIQTWRAFRMPPRNWGRLLGWLVAMVVASAWLEIGTMRVAVTMGRSMPYTPLFKEAQAAFMALKLPPVPPVAARRWINTKVSLAELEATGKLSAQTKYWLRNATLRIQVMRGVMGNTRSGPVDPHTSQDYANYFGVVDFSGGDSEGFLLAQKVFYLDNPPN